MCGKDPEIFAYVEKWIAHSLQMPGVKMSPMLTFISEEGAGKTIFLHILSQLYGPNKTLETTKPEQYVFGEFNEAMLGKYLVILSEIDKRNTKDSDGQNKGNITENTMMINPKGKTPVEIASYHRFIIATNNADPVRTHANDRRNVIIRSSDEAIGDFAYFKTLGELLTNRRALHSIYQYYMKEDLTGVLINSIPKTEYHKDMIKFNEPLHVRFLRAFAQDSNEAGLDFVDLQGKELLTTYTHWCLDEGLKGDGMDSAKLVKLILSNKELKACVTELPRSSGGQKRRYDIIKMMGVLNIAPIVGIEDI
jgi:hypothetical protein